MSIVYFHVFFIYFFFFCESHREPIQRGKRAACGSKTGDNATMSIYLTTVRNVWKSAQSPGKKWCNCMFLLSTDILYFGWYATFDMYHINISTLCVIPRSDEMCKCWLYIQGGERMVGGVTSERPLCENTSAWCRFGRHQIISWPCYWAQNQVFLPDIKGISSCVSGFMNILSQIMFFLSLT